MYQVTNGLKVWGQHDQNTLDQMFQLTQHPDVVDAALMSDGHRGFSQPIGGVIAYRENLSVSGAGADLACGNKAVRTNLTYGEIKNDLARIADEAATKVAFGIGRSTVLSDKQNHPLFEDDRWSVFGEAADKATEETLREMARGQLGTVGSSNHYLDFFAETSGVPQDDSPIWVGVHFGSRGLGFKTNAGFTNLINGHAFNDKVPKNEDEAVLVNRASDLGALYLEALSLAGSYAYAGRDYVVQQALDILGAHETYSVHNHHNFIWREKHNGEDLWVVRKGATPLHPGQESFIGGSMCDPAVIVKGRVLGEMRGCASDVTRQVAEQEAALYSTVHGAGRVMGRMAAKGKVAKDGTVKREGLVKREDFNQVVRDYGIHLRGGDLDESPFVYRRLKEVLKNHRSTLDILHELRPIIVCMAGADVRDPYKD